MRYGYNAVNILHDYERHLTKSTHYIQPHSLQLTVKYDVIWSAFYRHKTVYMYMKYYTNRHVYIEYRHKPTCIDR